MLRFCAAVAVLLCLLTPYAEAGDKVLTTNDRISLWAKRFATEFKKVKFKDAYNTFPDFADRAFDAIEAAGLQSGGTVFPTLAQDVQTVLTRLETTIDTTRDKRNDVRDKLNDLARDLRLAANSATPPALNVASDLILACYAAVLDGEVIEKERTLIMALAAEVTATPSLSTTLIADINTHVAAITTSIGIRKADLDVIATDIKLLMSLVK